MNQTEKGIITLLKSAVTGVPCPLPETFDLEDAYPLIRRHHITTMAYDGAVRCGLPRELPKMSELFQSYCKSLLVSQRQMQMIQRIYDAFDRNHIDYMPLKGCNMKSRYPKPELRMMGDADILIRPEQYDAITPLLENLGMAPKKETDHELVWENAALYLELHKHLIPSYNKDFYAFFGDGWQLARLSDGSRHAMTPEDEWIYLFTHFAKHFRDGGIGCRHMVDLWVYLRTYPQLDWNYVSSAMHQLKLLEFHENIRRLLAVWFEDAPADEKMDLMSQFVFSSGSWGAAESRLLSRTVRDSRHSPLGFSGKAVYIWNTLFPDVATLREKYTILKKAPYLLPLVWLIRPFYKLLFERHTLSRQKTNLNALDRDLMDSRAEMLRYIGLDYKF